MKTSAEKLSEEVAANRLIEVGPNVVAGTLTMDQMILERPCDVIQKENDDVFRSAYLIAHFQTCEGGRASLGRWLMY